VESFLRTFAKDYVGPIIMLNGISGESLAKRIVDCLSSESKAREFLNKQEDVNGGAGKILRRKP
jgi:Na+-transporting methylmalonyl-CoA/oxaloacetate decarboxylase beta subunit